MTPEAKEKQIKKIVEWTINNPEKAKEAQKKYRYLKEHS